MNFSEKTKRDVAVLLNSAFLFLFYKLFPDVPGLFYSAFAVLSFNCIINAEKSLLELDFFDENVLMSITSLSALFLGDITEGYSVMFFYSIGELISAVIQERYDRNAADIKDHDHEGEKPLRRFAKIYTPVIVVMALLFFVYFHFAEKCDYRFCFEKSLSFLVLSCPCALVISLPLCYSNAYLYMKRKHYPIVSMGDLYCRHNNDEKLARIKGICTAIVRIDIVLFVVAKMAVLVTNLLGMTPLLLATFADVGILVLEVVVSSIPFLFDFDSKTAG